MSDAEHEVLVDNDQLRQRLELVEQIARRAVAALIEAQDAASGGHEAWLDTALQDLDAG